MKKFALFTALLAVALFASSASAQVVCSGGVAVQSFGAVAVPQFQFQAVAPVVANQAFFAPLGAVQLNARHRARFGGAGRFGGRLGAGFSQRTVIRHRF